MQDPKNILKKLTESQSIFTPDDLEKFLKKHIDLKVDLIKKTFWENPDIVQLLDKNTNEPEKKYTTIQIIEEEKKIQRLADTIQRRSSFLTRVTPNSSNHSEHYLSQLNHEQLKAFETLTQGKSLSCLEGLAGTGKSYLLFALKQHYEANGYKVRAFGPDNATVKVLEQKDLQSKQHPSIPFQKPLFQKETNHPKQ